MSFSPSLCAAVCASVLLAACGGGSDGDDTTTPTPGTGTSTASFKAYGQLDAIAGIDSPATVTAPANSSGMVNGSITVGTMTGTLTPTSDNGYTPGGAITSVLTRHGIIELCNASGTGDGTNGLKSRYVLMPGAASAVAVTALKGKTLKLYEDCAQTARSTAVFQADGSVLEQDTSGASVTVSAAEITATFGTSGFTDADGTYIARAFQLANGKYAFVSHGLPSGASGRGYIEFFIEE